MDIRRRSISRIIENGESGSDIIIDNYLTIEALEDGLTASLSANSVLYCIDGDGDWVTLSADTPTPSINKGHTLSFKGNLSPKNSSSGIGTFTISKSCNLSGNCMSLLYGDDASINYSLLGKDFAFLKLFYRCTTIKNAHNLILHATTLANNCYESMFRGCTSLVTAPELPATNLSGSCYLDMFYGCTSLVIAPSLPATNLSGSCYSSMFRGCTSLETAPELPATNLSGSCYYLMFYECKSLTTAPELPAKTLVYNCYGNMFTRCSKLNYIKMLAIDISASNCLIYWVNGVSNTGTFVKNSNMTTLPSGNNGIPSGWTVVNDGEDGSDIIIDNYLTIEALEDGLTASLSVNSVLYCIDGDGDWVTLSADTPTPSINTGQTLSFKGNLRPNSSISGIGTFTISKSCNLSGNCMSLLYGDDASVNYNISGIGTTFYKLFYNCTTIKNAHNLILSATKLGLYSYNFMFYGCTSLTTAPALPATDLNIKCYDSMFYGCTSLTTAPALPATTLNSSCYQSMFYGCSSLTTAPKLPATALEEFCYRYMFLGCTSLVTAPSLPAKNLYGYCYSYMFYGCSSLTTAPKLPATTLTNSCYSYMFRGCTSLTTAPSLPATTLTGSCYSYMFRGCSKLNYIKMLATDISASSCLSNWVYGVSSTGTFVKNPSMTTLPTGNSGIPSKWTVVDNT